MNFGRLECRPYSVAEAIADPCLDGQVVSVHGILFYGEGCKPNEFLLYNKDGTFDGAGPIPMPNESDIDRGKCFRMTEPDLQMRLGSGAMGLYVWKEDAIVIGELCRKYDSTNPFEIGNLWLIIMQGWEDGGVGKPYHSMRIVDFGRGPASASHWSSPVQRLGSATVDVFPKGGIQLEGRRV